MWYSEANSTFQHRAVTFSQGAANDETTNIGYGLIGAYVIVFVGIAVRMAIGR
jgi:hypothetical protein